MLTFDDMNLTSRSASTTSRSPTSECSPASSTPSPRSAPACATATSPSPRSPSGEPLKAECDHFLECVHQGRQPATHGRERPRGGARPGGHRALDPATAAARRRCIDDHAIPLVDLQGAAPASRRGGAGRLRPRPREDRLHPGRGGRRVRGGFAELRRRAALHRRRQRHRRAGARCARARHRPRRRGHRAGQHLHRHARSAVARAGRRPCWSTATPTTT